MAELHAFLKDSVDHIRTSIEAEYDKLMQRHFLKITHEVNVDEYARNYGKIDISGIEIRALSKKRGALYTEKMSKCIAFDKMAPPTWPICFISRCSKTPEMRADPYPITAATEVYEFGVSNTIVIDNYCNLWILIDSSIPNGAWIVNYTRVTESTIPMSNALISMAKKTFNNFKDDTVWVRQLGHGNGAWDRSSPALTSNINYKQFITDTIAAFQELTKHYNEKFIQVKPLYAMGNVPELCVMKQELDLIKKQNEKLVKDFSDLTNAKLASEARLNTEIQQMSEKMETIYKDHKHEIFKMDSIIRNLEELVATQKENIKSLESKILRRDQEIISLQKTIAEHLANTESLMSSYNRDVEKYQTTIIDLSEKNRVLRNTVTQYVIQSNSA